MYYGHLSHRSLFGLDIGVRDGCIFPTRSLTSALDWRITFYPIERRFTNRSVSAGAVTMKRDDGSDLKTKFPSSGRNVTFLEFRVIHRGRISFDDKMQ